MNIKEIDSLFHKLWTKAVGTKDYNKKEWLELERNIWDLWGKYANLTSVQAESLPISPVNKNQIN